MKSAFDERADRLVEVGRNIGDQVIHQIAEDKSISSDIRERIFVMKVAASRMIATDIYNMVVQTQKPFSEILENVFEGIHAEFHAIENDIKVSAIVVTNEGSHGVS